MEFLSAFDLHISCSALSRGLIHKLYAVFEMNGDRKGFVCFPGECLRSSAGCLCGKGRGQLRGCRIRHLAKGRFDFPQHVFGCCGKVSAKAGLSVIQKIHQIVLHGPGFGRAAILLHNALDVVSVEGVSPAGSAIAVKHGFPKVLIIAAFIKLDHLFIGRSGRRRAHGVLHAVGVYRVGFAVHLIAHIFV